jgi:hypothetical protein
VQALDEGPPEQIGQGRTQAGAGDVGVLLGAVGRVGRVLAEQRLLAVAEQLLLLGRPGVGDAPAVQGVAEEQVLVDEDGQGVQVGAGVGVLALGVGRGQVQGGQHLRGDVALGAGHVGREQPLDDERVDVDDDAGAAGGVDQDVVGAEVGVGQPGVVQAGDGPGHLHAQGQVIPEVPQLGGRELLQQGAVLAAEEAHAVLLLALDEVGAGLEEEVAGVGRGQDAEARPGQVLRCRLAGSSWRREVRKSVSPE